MYKFRSRYSISYANGCRFSLHGHRFINTKESLADEDYKKMIIDSTANDIVYTAAVSGVNANFLRPSLEAMGITEDLGLNVKWLDFDLNTFEN